MQRTAFGEMTCSIARTLDIAGEPWTPLILRDLFVGIRRFDDLQRDLGISRKVLTQRLNHLLNHGIVERRPYTDKPVRYDYLLTDKGWELCDVLLAITAWGDRWTADEQGPPVILHHTTCRHTAHAIITCSACNEPLRARDVHVTPGPGASPAAVAPSETAA